MALEKTLVWKIVLLIVLLFFDLFFTSLPVFRRFCSKYQKIISVIITLSKGFAAGVLLGVALLYLFPDSNNNITEILQDWYAPVYVKNMNLSFIVGFLGIFLILFAENFSLLLMTSIQNKRRPKRIPEREENSLESSLIEVENIEIPENDGTLGDQDSIVQSEQCESLESVVSEVVSEKALLINSKKGVPEKDEEKSHEDLIVDVFGRKDISMMEKVITTCFLWFSLSLHAFLEGLAFGSLYELNGSFYGIFIAMIVHKPPEDYALGVKLEEGIKNKLSFFFFVVLFSISNPIGIITGIVFSSISSELIFLFISNICMSFAAGVFLLVGLEDFVFDFLKENKSIPSFLLFFSFLGIGFVLMIVLRVSEYFLEN